MADFPTFQIKTRPGQPAAAPALDITPLRSVLENWQAREQERSIARTEVEAGREGAKAGIQDLMRPTTRAGRAWNKAAVLANAPKMELDAKQVVQDHLESWQRGEFGEDVGKVNISLRKAKSALLAGVDPDAAMVYGPRVDEILDKGILAVGADFNAQRMAADKATATAGAQTLFDEAMIAAEEGNSAESLELGTLYTEFVTEGVKTGIYGVDEGATMQANFFNTLNVQDLKGSWRGIDGDYQIGEVMSAVRDLPAGVTLDQRDTAVQEALYEINLLATRSKAEAEAGAKARKATEDEGVARSSQMIFGGEAYEQNIGPEQLIANFEDNTDILFSQANQSKIRSDYRLYLDNRGTVTADRQTIAQARMDIYAGTLDGEGVDDLYRNALDSPRKTGVDDVAHKELRSLEASVSSAAETAAEKGQGEDFRLAREQLRSAMGMVADPLASMTGGILPSDGRQEERYSSLAEFHDRVTRGENPYEAAERVVTKHKWVDYKEKRELIYNNDILNYDPNTEAWRSNFKQSVEELKDRYLSGEVSRGNYLRTVVVWQDLISLPTDIQGE